MWRMWTYGWGVKSWWSWFREDGFPIWVAWRLPKRIAFWTFIRIYSKDGQAPGIEYDRVCREWDKQ